jgi:membrane fusion protein (multidrug efflux system)
MQRNKATAMKHTAILAAILLLSACGGGSKNDAASSTDRKVQLETLKKERDGLNARITRLEDEILKSDPNTAKEKTKLVGFTAIAPQTFSHYIDLQGKIATENIYFVTPRGMGGQVKEIRVKAGDPVRKGQLIMKLDDAIVRQNVKQLETQQNFAKNLYERQKNLWNEGIGTEVQFLTAKNNVDQLEKQMDILKEQLSTFVVYSEVNGVVETVNIRVGETFTGNPAAGITIVNPSNLKAVVDVPENYVSRIRKGMPVVVDVPDAAKRFNTQVSLVSETISANTRSFIAEAKLPSDPNLKPNSVAVVRILDHEAKDALVVPVSTVQTDEKGKFVYVLSEEGGKKLARRKSVTIGELYDEMIEVKSGLTTGDKLINKGFQGLYEGQVLTTDVQ